MGHDVFISHSSLDKLAADAVCHGLEANGVRCWIAPRDQIAGRPYGQQITSAIETAQVVVLVFSDNVNHSQAVLNEINIAAGANRTIVPFRLAQVEFNPELHFYLGRMHWLDAFPQPIDTYIDALVATVRRNLDREPAAETSDAAAAPASEPTASQPPAPSAPAAPPGPPTPSPAAVAPPPQPASPGTAAPAPPKTDLRPLAIIGGVAGVVVLIALVVALSPHPPPSPGAASAANTIESAVVNKVVADINNDKSDDKGDAAANATDTGGAEQPARGDGSEIVPVRAANPGLVNYYETVLAPDGPPAALDGATVISTVQLLASMKDRDTGSTSFWLIDARGCTNEPTIPTAVCLSANSVDQLQLKVPNKSTQLVVFCHDGSCPMSYQLASAAVAAGYENVFWYRGGINAWVAAGEPTVTHSGGPS